MRQKLVILMLVGISICLFVKKDTTKSLFQKVSQEKTDGYIEHIVNPDGTISEKIVDAKEAQKDIERTIKNGPTTGSSWVSYVENPDGTYTSRLGVTYKYMKQVKFSDDWYWIFANKENVAQEDVLKLLSASSDANYIQWGMEFVRTK